MPVTWHTVRSRTTAPPTVELCMRIAGARRPTRPGRGHVTCESSSEEHDVTESVSESENPVNPFPDSEADSAEDEP